MIFVMCTFLVMTEATTTNLRPEQLLVAVGLQRRCIEDAKLHRALRLAMLGGILNITATVLYCS